MSGSRSIWLGWAWWALCLATHHPKLNPIKALPTTNPSQRLARRDPNTCRWPASWPTKPSWVNISPNNTASARVSQEFPTTRNAAQPAVKTANVATIFTR